MKKIAIIGAGEMTTIIACRAQELGIETHCFAWEKGATAKDDVDFFYPISIMEKDRILEKCKQIGIDGVIATTELTIPVAAYISNVMGLNGNPVEVAERITNKYKNRELCSQLTYLHNPKYNFVQSEEEIGNLFQKYPIILKPLEEGGKRGITVVYKKEDLQTAWIYAVENNRKIQRGILAEEFMPGETIYSVESLSYHGEHYIIQITQTETSGAPHCIELSSHQPARVSDELKKDIEKAITEGLTAIGIQNGPCHTEIKIMDGKVFLLEFNGRPGGGNVAYPMTELSTGYPYITGIIQIALDDFVSPDISNFSRRNVGEYWVSVQTKQIMEIFDSCENYTWLYEKHKEKDTINEMITSEDQTDYFIYVYDDEDPVECLLREKTVLEE